MHIDDFTGTHRLTLVEGKTLAITMERLGHVLPETLPDGFYETVSPGLDLSLFRIRNGVHRALTEKQFRVQIAGAAARDPQTRMVDRSKLTMMTRRDAVVAEAIKFDILNFLPGSVNGTKVDVTIVFETSQLEASRGQYDCGTYRGAHKGYTIWGMEHYISMTTDGYIRAMRTFSYTDLGDGLIALDAKLARHADGGVQIFSVICLRGTCRGNEIVERAVALYPDYRLEYAKSVRGMLSRITAENNGVERQRLAKLAAERDREREEMERPMREAEQAAAERDRLQRIEDATERRSRTIVPKGDMDSLGGVNF